MKREPEPEQEKGEEADEDELYHSIMSLGKEDAFRPSSIIIED